MITFITPLRAEALEDGVRWKLLEDLVIDIGKIDGKEIIRIPTGFVTDFGSVPGPLKVIVNPQGKAKPAYVLHDYLYGTQEFNRLVSDAMLIDAMETLNVNWFQRLLVYRGLRIGGFVAWNQHKKKLRA